MSDNVIKAVACSSRAVQFDKEGCYEAASFYYKEAAKYLYLAVTHEDCSESDKQDWSRKSKEYDSRSDVLKRKALEISASKSQSISHQALQRCNFLFEQALNADEKDLKDIAVDLYGQIAEYVLKVKSSIEDDIVTKKILQRADQALTRAEQLKFSQAPGSSSVSYQSAAESPLVNSTTVSKSDKPRVYQDSSPHLKITGGSDSYSEEEKKVLLSTSKINGIDYVPFMDIDLKERFQYAIPFTDRAGHLKLSPKQKLVFKGWVRPENIFPEPRMVANDLIDYRSIKQTVISDCSFVASLAVSALYEKRFSKKLITSIIYPRNKNKDPIYNPFGKYMIKLNINGVLRKVIIDDEMPVDQYGNLLCSYSTRQGELWVSLLEKAYMKVMGGYDFPGSNSVNAAKVALELVVYSIQLQNIDLHALTGWIPERIAIRPNDETFNANATFNMMKKRMHAGHCIGTVATGELSPADEERTGLVATHAYAILDVVVDQATGARLFQLKNPWSHVRWRGNYSELDSHHWTPALRTSLNFDPDNASVFDNGIFWIDYESILKFFDVFYLSWDPAIFSCTYCTHQLWRAGEGPSKDLYNIGENPQFKLHIPGTKSGSVWVLLTRHITNLNDFKDNHEFIALLVYKTNGKKVYYPGDPPPYIDGVRINSPHYLCKILLTETSQRTFTLVVSQYEKTTNIYFSLRAYATLPFSLSKIDVPYSCIKKINGEWKGESAGGCTNHPHSYMKNPCFYLHIESPGAKFLLIDLKGPKQFSIGFILVRVDGNEKDIEQFGRKTSGPYRSGFVVLELENVECGIYTITPTTFLPSQEGPFILNIKSTCSISITKK